MLQLRPGASVVEAHKALEAAKLDASNIRGAQTVDVRINKYRQWVVRSARQLGGHLASPAIDELILTRTYWALLSVIPTEEGLGALGELLDFELGERIDAISAAQDALDTASGQWGRWHGSVLPPSRRYAIVLDTNVMLRHHGELRDLDWAARAGIRQMESITLGIPMAVIEELDRLKRDNGSMLINGREQKRRTLARQALKELDQLFAGMVTAVPLRQSSADVLVGELYAVLTTDDPMHLPIPKSDLEIIDQAQRIKPFAADVKLATYDQSMIFRARAVGLEGFRPTDED